MKTILGFVGFLAMAVASPVAGQPKTPDTRAEVQAFVRGFFRTMNEADVAALVEMYARVPDVASISDGEITRGWEAIRADADSMLGMQGRYRVDVGSTDVVALGTAHAVAFAPATITVPVEGGSVQVRGAFTLVLRKTPGGWKILHEHSSLQGMGD
jgi:beta-aspartyl-peptidase (threonine type)